MKSNAMYEIIDGQMKIYIQFNSIDNNSFNNNYTNEWSKNDLKLIQMNWNFNIKNSSKT